MQGINCNIIRDLLPSYVDRICSEDSRRLIEEHIRGCEQCHTQLELLKDTELTDDHGEQKQILYAKKVKRYYEKGIASLVFLTLMLIGGALFIITHYGMNGRNLLYIVCPLSVIAAYCLTPDHPLALRRCRLSGILVAVSVLAGVTAIAYYSYAVLYLRWNTSAAMSETGVFGIPLDETGPYLEKRLVFTAIAQLGIFILSDMMIFRGYRIHKSIYGLTLTGFWLATGYICTLYNMSTPEGLYRLLAVMTICLVAEGIVFSVAAHNFARKVLSQ